MIIIKLLKILKKKEENFSKIEEQNPDIFIKEAKKEEILEQEDFFEKEESSHNLEKKEKTIEKEQINQKKIDIIEKQINIETKKPIEEIEKIN